MAVQGDVVLDQADTLAPPKGDFEKANIKLAEAVNRGELQISQEAADALATVTTRNADGSFSATKEPPKGWTWHHHQEPGRMQLVKFEVHDPISHLGGSRLWGQTLFAELRKILS